jgi:hypothetical protein
MSEPDNWERERYAVRQLIECSLPFVDEVKFNAHDTCRWGFICFVVGAVSYTCPSAGREVIESLATSVIVDVFAWPVSGTKELVVSVCDNRDQGLDSELFQSGENAAAEFEHAIGWLAAVVDAIEN